MVCVSESECVCMSILGGDNHKTFIIYSYMFSNFFQTFF